MNARSAEGDLARRSDLATRRAALLRRLATEPYRFDLFAALRRIEALHPDKPRLGEAARPVDEPVRFAQEPSLTFAPAAVASFVEARPAARLTQRVFGFVGPNGPLPTHLTEYTRERTLHHGDATMQRFLDTLLHRFGLLFYRAWARAQPVVTLDRKSDSRVARHLGSLAGLTETIHRDADPLGHEPKLYFMPRLARSVRDAEGLAAWVSTWFGVRARVEQNVGHWMTLDVAERSRLERHGQPALGRGVVLGRTIWDVQHKFRIVIGPLDFAAFRRFLPGTPALGQLRAMVRQYVGFEFEWDVQLVLAKVEVPRWNLGADAAVGQLGRTSWVGLRRVLDAGELVLNVENLGPRIGPAAGGQRAQGRE